MHFKIQVVTITPDGDEVVHEIASVARDRVEPETLGLRAYPNNPAARKAIRAQAKCSKAR